MLRQVWRYKLSWLPIFGCKVADYKSRLCREHFSAPPLHGSEYGPYLLAPKNLDSTVQQKIKISTTKAPQIMGISPRGSHFASQTGGIHPVEQLSRVLVREDVQVDADPRRPMFHMLTPPVSKTATRRRLPDGCARSCSTHANAIGSGGS